MGKSAPIQYPRMAQLRKGRLTNLIKIPIFLVTPHEGIEGYFNAGRDTCIGSWGRYGYL